MRAVSRAAWTREVLRTGHLTATHKVILLALAQKMRADGTVSYPRRHLALDLGYLPNADGEVNQRSVAKALQAAHDAGFLVQVTAGYEGHTAEYRAELPTRIGPQPTRNHHRQRVSKTDTLSGAQRVSKASTLSTPAEGVQNRHPISKRHSASRLGEHVAVTRTASDVTTTTAAATPAASPTPQTPQTGGEPQTTSARAALHLVTDDRRSA